MEVIWFAAELDMTVHWEECMVLEELRPLIGPR